MAPIVTDGQPRYNVASAKLSSEAWTFGVSRPGGRTRFDLEQAVQ